MLLLLLVKRLLLLLPLLLSLEASPLPLLRLRSFRPPSLVLHERPQAGDFERHVTADGKAQEVRP